MTKVIDLAPHDPLPDGPALVLLRRFEEDDPKLIMTELIAIDANQRESNIRMNNPDGAELTWKDATRRAMETAAEGQFPILHRIDRTAGPREQEVLAHNGDHSPASMGDLDDFDLEDGEHGPDMRDRNHNAAPRKF
jgi:hypothetical protein